MKTSTKYVIISVIFIMLVLASLSIFILPNPLAADGAKQGFSAVRAMKHVEVIAAKTHPVGTPELAEVRNYIINELKKIGLQPEIQTGVRTNDSTGFLSFVPYSGELNNITARLEGAENSGQDIVLVAHYDTTLGGPGAADDTSGVAVLLETARALISSNPLKNDIVFLFTDGEEAELLGSKLFAEESELMKNISLVVNVESRGNRGPSIMFESSQGNRWLIKEFLKAAPDSVAYSFTTDAYKLVSNVTDFTPFLEAGKSGFNLANLSGLEIYHNPQDTPENLSPSFLQHHGAIVLSLARHFGNIPLDQVIEMHNAVYFTIARTVTISYSSQWNILFTVLGLLLFILALAIGIRSKKITIKSSLQGFLISVLILIAVTVIGFAIQTFFTKLYFKLERVLTLDDLVNLRRLLVFEGNKWFVGSLMITGLIIWLLQRLFRKRITAANLFFGNTITWALISSVSAFLLPSAHYLFLWPFFFAAIESLLEVCMPDKNDLKCLMRVTLCAIPCILIYIPVGYLLFQSLTMLAAVVPLAILSLPAAMLFSTDFNAPQKAA